MNLDERLKRLERRQAPIFADAIYPAFKQLGIEGHAPASGESVREWLERLPPDVYERIADIVLCQSMGAKAPVKRPATNCGRSRA